MGQGAEDAGGYEIDYDPAYEGLSRNVPCWNDMTPVNKMSKSHIINALRVCRRLVGNCTFSCDDDKWEEWIDVLERELNSRRFNKVTKSEKVVTAKPSRGKKQKMKCHCGVIYEARVADLKRGYAKSCSKSCAAIRREFGRPVATKVEE